MVTADRRYLSLTRRGTAVRAACAALAGLVLAGCSSLDPTGLLAEEDAAEPRQVDAGQAADGEGDYPDLDDVPDEPKRRPSDKQEREALEESLASDRENARYSDEDLRSPEAAPEQPDVGADREAGARETGGQGSRANDGGGMRETAERTGETARSDARDAGQAAARDSTDDAMPEMPKAPSDSGGTRAADPEQKGDVRRRGQQQTGESATQRMRADERTRQGQPSEQQGQPSKPRGRGTQTARTDSNGQQPGGGQTGANREPQQTPSTSNGAAVQVNRSEIPQMQPSRAGEPVQLPGEVRQRFGAPASTSQRGVATGGQQTARLQSPPSSADQVSPGQAGAGEGTRVAVIYFPHGTASLDGEDRQVLREVANLYEKRDAGLRVVGHASSRTATMGMIDHRMVNLDTSMRRAETVADTLVRLGVPRGEIQVEARADRDPAYHEFMPTGEAGNRRAEIFLGG